ncbi:hypothetical protein ACFQ6N_29585 [Kitasatospora sp. NPDC056446]|uniref:hypothetical protein n=1 Tax=Kitasatospora sp. NPDC056446 TaxID=3345819 RepID=UPI0036A7BC25
MSTDDTGTRKHDDSHEDDTVRERSAEERSITAPTPKDVRAKADDVHEDDDDAGREDEPPAADTQAP